MTATRCRTLLTLMLVSIGIAARAGTLADALVWQDATGSTWLQASLSAELTAYQSDEPPPALILDADGSFLQPRLTLLADAGISDRLVAHATLNADRGLDPGYRPQGQLRFDEYFLQARVLDKVRGQLRIGKFATVFGRWISRHRAADNPFISAPALYEDMLPATDTGVPATVAAFLGRRDRPEVKPAWLPVVWGPSYTTGGSVAAAFGSVEIAVEAKNAGLASRPAAWDIFEEGWETEPVWTGRIAWRPGPEVTLGLSYSTGPYLRSRTRSELPAGRSVDDYRQTTTALDLSWERRQWQLWVEAMRASFDVPAVGTVDMTGAFAELRYKFALHWWLAARWNRSAFDDVPGTATAWDRTLQRTDLALGYRQNRDLTFKLEWNRGSQAGGNVMGRNVVALQMVLAL
ncbi:MAG: hypothetical protein H6993_04395 [Pseudomonadales bacterium]|nr:hypothetical protein [Pseudomonadales bacterium]